MKSMIDSLNWMIVSLDPGMSVTKRKKSILVLAMLEVALQDTLHDAARFGVASRQPGRHCHHFCRRRDIKERLLHLHCGGTQWECRTHLCHLACRLLVLQWTRT